VADTAAMQVWRKQALAFTQTHKGAARRVAGLVKDLLSS
jgi:hypothetical protein